MGGMYKIRMLDGNGKRWMLRSAQRVCSHLPLFTADSVVSAKVENEPNWLVHTNIPTMLEN
jgi:hypothetical protein